MRVGGGVRVREGGEEQRSGEDGAPGASRPAVSLCCAPGGKAGAEWAATL